MIQVRRGVFETNSSSTHALSMTNKHIDEAELDSAVFEKEYIIKRFNENEVDDVMEITTIEDKLRYFLTLFCQTSYFDYDPDSKRIKCMKALKNIFPNAIFELNVDYCYVFEDGEWFFDGFEPCCDELMDENTLKKFMLYGTVNFGDRDNQNYSDKIYRIGNSDMWVVSWSG